MKLDKLKEEMLDTYNKAEYTHMEAELFNYENDGSSESIDIKMWTFYLMGVVGVAIFIPSFLLVRNTLDAIIYITFLLCLIFLVILIIENKILIKRLKHKNIAKLTHVDYKYYRDLLNINSPEILSMCYDELKNYKNMLNATLVYLKNNNIIDLDGNKVKVLNINANVPIYEEYLLLYINRYKNIHNEDITLDILYQKNSFKTVYTNIIKMEAVNNGYYKIDKALVNQYKIFEILERIILLYPTLTTFIYAFLLNDSAINIFVYMAFCFAIITMAFSLTKRNLFITEKGYDIYNKLCGLDNYLKDFSNMKDREVEEIKVWDDYIIYALIFGILDNTKSLNEYLNKKESTND